MTPCTQFAQRCCLLSGKCCNLWLLRKPLGQFFWKSYEGYITGHKQHSLSWNKGSIFTLGLLITFVKGLKKWRKKLNFSELFWPMPHQGPSLKDETKKLWKSFVESWKKSWKRGESLWFFLTKTSSALRPELVSLSNNSLDWLIITSGLKVNYWTIQSLPVGSSD